MRLNIFSIFPEIIESFCCISLIGKTLKKGLWELKVINPRDYAQNGRVDDTPYGGGRGMVFRPDVLGTALERNCSSEEIILHPSPRGVPLEQSWLREVSLKKNISIICGRYEGIDQRLLDEFQVQEISLGDFVIMGGELPALIMIEGIVRCLDQVINPESFLEDSFGGGFIDSLYRNLLEYPLYTKPFIWKARQVPQVLLSGHHRRISQWRLAQAENNTRQKRPDLYIKYLRKKASFLTKIT
jgi:tRNA (guanine37-N1)-methyltransferase